jgi:hypothetical protein
LLDKLAQLLEQSGDYAQAQQYANQHVQLAPWRESAHRQLMRLFALQEQRSAALAQYEMCRELLAQELGVEPEAETVRLWQQIRDGTLATAVVTKPTTRLHRFPTQLTPFIRCQTEISQIMAKLADENCRLLTLIGPGGVGKTRLRGRNASSGGGTRRSRRWPRRRRTTGGSRAGGRARYGAGGSWCGSSRPRRRRRRSSRRRAHWSRRRSAPRVVPRPSRAPGRSGQLHAA